MEKVLFFLIIISTGLTSFAQKAAGTITGTVVDSISAIPLEDASISLISESDSSIKLFTNSSKSGRFNINNVDTGNYILIVSYSGLEPIKKFIFASNEKNTVELGIIRMRKAYKNLGEVIVKDLVPIRVNGDTLSYKADAFKTKSDASVENLLKKLPGVQVARNGEVKAQGEQVQKVYVDGKEFFSNDPKVATKNLTADMIDRVEVYNETSEQSKFSGIDDGSRAKAINLKLKKDKKSGLLSKVSAGYGTENRYNTNITANYFKGPSQISLVASTKNTNNIDYSGSNMGQGSNREGNGITQTSSVGLNYRDAWNKNVYVTGSYSYNHSNANNVRKSYKQTFFTDSTLLSDRETIYNNISTNQRFNVNVVYTIDSLNSIIYTSYYNSQNSRNINSASLVEMVDKKGSQYKANDGRTINSGNGLGYNWNNNLLWRRKFNKRGRTFSVNLMNTVNENKRTSYNINSSRFYNKDGEVYRGRDIDYKIGNNSDANTLGVNLSYTEPIAENNIVEFNYSYNNNKNTSDRRTYNYNGVTKGYDQLIDSLTNDFQNTNEYNRIGTNLKGGNKTYNYQLGFAVQKTLLKGTDLSKKINFRQNYINLLPAASFNYKLAKNKNLQISYRGNNTPPGIMQLQNITDITNYPYIQKGNPDLQQEFTNSVMLNYNFFNTSKLQNLFAYISFRSTRNKIVNSIEQKAGEQISMPVNINGVYNISGNFNFGVPIKKMKGGNFNTTTNIDYGRNASVVNNATNFANNVTISQDVTLNYNTNDKLDVGINANMTYNAISYTIQKTQNNSYFTHSYSVDASYTFPAGFILSTDADYTKTSQRAVGFNQDYIIWNASISKQLFKNNRGEIKFLVNDILNQNRNISRNAFDNYIEDVQSITLKRFALLIFTLKINKMGK